MKKRVVGWGEINHLAMGIRNRLRAVSSKPLVYGIPRGGCAVAALVGTPVDEPSVADAIVDDVRDSGKTLAAYERNYPGKPLFVLYDKTVGEAKGEWLVFPWEIEGEGEGAEDGVRRLLQAIGEDPDREGLADTPGRVVRAMREMTSGHTVDVAELLERRFTERADEMVVVRDIPFWSLCEHHLLPFHGHATVAYLPSDQVLGLSKIPRLVHAFARRLQVQERMTRQISEAMMEHLEPLGAACTVTASHTCAEARGVGVRSPMVTSSLLGAFRELAAVRAEFFRLSRNAGA